MVSELINANPVVYEKKERRTRTAPVDLDEYAIEPIDQLEIFDILLYVFDLFSVDYFCLLTRIEDFIFQPNHIISYALHCGKLNIRFLSIYQHFQEVLKYNLLEINDIIILLH